MDSPTEERLLDLLQALTLSQNWEDVHQALTIHPELLSRQSVELFRRMIGLLEQQGYFKEARRFHRFYEVLLEAREKGVDVAIAHARGDSGAVPPELQALLRELSRREPAADKQAERILLIEQALAMADREGSPQIWAGLHGMLGDSLLERVDGDREEHVERALFAYQEALSLLSKAAEPVLWALTTNSMARAYRRRMRGGGEEDDDRQALEAFRAALSVLTGERGPRLLRSDSEETLVRLATGSPQDLDSAIQHLQRLLLFLNSVAGQVDGVVDIPRLELLLRHQVSLETVGGDASIEEVRQGSSPATAEGQSIGSESDEQAWDQAAAGGRRLTEYWDTGQLETLLEALQLLGTAAASISATSSDRADVLYLRGMALRAYHERTGSLETLEQAIACHQEAIALIGSDSPSRADHLINLGEALGERYRQTGEPADLDQAIDLAQQATALATSAEGRAAFLRVLADGLRTRYSDRGDARDLEVAVQTLRQALPLTSPASRDGRGILTSMAAALLVRYNALGDIADLEEAIERSREAIDDTPAASHDRAVVQYGLGRGLSGRYDHQGDVADLDEAIEAFREALSNAPIGSPDRADILRSLGTALNRRYDRTGEAALLDESLSVWQQAVDLLAADSRERPSVLNTLSVGLRDRYYRDGNVVDLDRAIRLSQQALASTFGTRAEPIYLVGLGIGLYQRYNRDGDRADLERAIELWREALDHTPASDPDRPEILKTLGDGLYTRYRLSGDGADLQRSLASWQEAFDLTPPSSPDRSSYSNSIAAGLMERYEQEGDTEALERAVELIRQAVDTTPKGAASRIVYVGNLAIALGKRYDRGGAPADLEEAKDLFREATSAGLTTKLEDALEKSLIWGDWAFERSSWNEAAEALGLAFQAVDGLLRNQLVRAGKETWLREAQALPSRAAFALAQVDDLTGAVEFLERGRVRLLAEAQERDRVELERLKELDQGDVYDAFRSAVQQATQLESKHQAEVGLGDDMEVEAALRAAQARVRAATDRIRRVPGYEGLFQSPDFSQIQELLTDPLEGDSASAVGMYLAVTRRGGLALIVLPDGVQKVWLDFDHDDLVQRLVDHQDGGVVGGYLPALFQPSRLRAALEELLPWLGEKVVLPVMEVLNDRAGSRVGDPPTPVMIVPTGYLGLLPLHAATRQVGGQVRGCLDDWAVTYVLSARALGHSRLALSSAPTASSSLVGLANPLPLPEGVASLTFAEAEVDEVAELFGEAGQVVRRTQATRVAFERLVAGATYVHLACHAQFDPQDPLSSGFILSNGERLRLADLFGLPRLSATRLAVLSACQTAVSDFNNLPEEAIGLPAGFLQTGVAGVIGTLWPVNDISTALLLIRFYRILFENGRHRPVHPALALRQAQLWLRGVSNSELADLFDRYQQAGRGGVGLSRDVARAKFREYALRDPDERPFEHPYYWAPFVFYGS